MTIKITGYYKLPYQEEPCLVDFNEVFNLAFMRKYTRYRSFEKFLLGGHFHIANQQDFESLPEEVMDAHVKKTTKFSSWQEMLNFGTDRFILKHSS